MSIVEFFGYNTYQDDSIQRLLVQITESTYSFSEALKRQEQEEEEVVPDSGKMDVDEGTSNQKEAQQEQ